jgi:hypothetical protein
MEKKKSHDIQIVELFLVKADWNRVFVGEIQRGKNKEGKPIVCGTVVINEGKVWSAAETQDELGNFLDDLCVMKLDYKLHSNIGKSVVIAATPFSLN